MKKIEAQKGGKKTWAGAWKQVKADWYEALEFDRRGTYLSVLLLLAGASAIALAPDVVVQQGRTQEWREALIFLCGFCGSFFLAAILKYRFNKIIASVVAIVVVVVVVFDIAIAFDFSVGFAVIFAVAVAVGFAIAVAGAFSFAIALVIALAVAVVFAGYYTYESVGSFGHGVTAAVLLLVYSGLILLLRNSIRSFRLFERARKFQHKEYKSKKVYKETTALRQGCSALLRTLQAQQRAITIGLAGRRGLGKTALLREALREHAALQPSRLEQDRDLKEVEKVKAERIHHFTLFVPTPTEFAEQTFLLALLERVAQTFNETLAQLLPAVKSFAAEQELREKRRVLRLNHALQLALFILTFGCNWYFLNHSNRAPALPRFFFQYNPLIDERVALSKLYTSMKDSLSHKVWSQSFDLFSSMEEIENLLNPDVTKESWNHNKSNPDKFLIQATWDSLKRSASWSKLDSVRQTHQRYQATLDSIQATSLRYIALVDTFDLLTHRAFAANSSYVTYAGWFWFICALLLLIFPAYYFSREGERRFAKRVYGVVRNEIALYERTNALLERLHFQMSFSESKEAGAGFSQSGLQLSRKFSKQVQRQARPYTTMSLIDEYRDYIADAKLYLNDALKQDDPNTQERLKIVIAIDELDKILDTDKLHNMLKSMKAIFEIEDVCYILSISEDALETYRLRHVDTKNEIDSAFTHIIPVPPMDALGSLAFYLENHGSTDFPRSGGAEKNADSKQHPPGPPQGGNRSEDAALREGWPPQLLPAAIVFGGGVPRDMHRLSQVLGASMADKSLKDCLEQLANEDRSACEDMVLMHAQLSDEGKQFWLKILASTGFTSKEETAALLHEIETHTLENFIAMNACSGDKAKEHFHRLRSLVRGIVVKGHVYHATAQSATPPLLAEWPQESALESFIAALPENGELKIWFDELEPLRDAIFELSRNPLRVWERLAS